MAVRERHPRCQRRFNVGPGSADGIRTRPLTADAGRILTVCRCTAAATTETNVPPTGHAVGEGGADRTRMPGRRVKGYYLDRGVNARVRRLSHGAPQAGSRSDQQPGVYAAVDRTSSTSQSPVLNVSHCRGADRRWFPYWHVLGVALAPGKLFDLQIAPDVRPLTSDEQAQDCGNQQQPRLRITMYLLLSTSVSPRVSPAGRLVSEGTRPARAGLPEACRAAGRWPHGSLGWMSRGACQREDPELFFPIAATGPALQQISAAKAVCRRCSVHARCLSYALETMQDGVWGGTTGEERRAMREPSPWCAGLSGGAVNLAITAEPGAIAAHAARRRPGLAGTP